MVYIFLGDYRQILSDKCSSERHELPARLWKSMSHYVSLTLYKPPQADVMLA
jgi:hypothetical protein